LIGGACLFGIYARIAQADVHQKRTTQSLTQEMEELKSQSSQEG